MSEMSCFPCLDKRSTSLPVPASDNVQVDDKRVQFDPGKLQVRTNHVTLFVFLDDRSSSCHFILFYLYLKYCKLFLSFVFLFFFYLYILY